MWDTAAHIIGTQITEVDSFSRNFSEAIECKLSTHSLEKNSCIFGNPTLYLFVSHINHQIDRYIYWKLDSRIIAIDFFSIK